MTTDESGPLPPALETLPDGLIPRGQAELHLSAALDAVTVAFERLEAVAMAMARQIDAAAEVQS